MLNKIQKVDSKKCNDMSENGEDMECFGCSCMVCVAQAPNHYKKKYKELQMLVDMMLFNASTQFEDFMGEKELYEFFFKDIIEYMENNQEG